MEVTSYQVYICWFHTDNLPLLQKSIQAWQGSWNQIFMAPFNLIYPMIFHLSKGLVLLQFWKHSLKKCVCHETLTVLLGTEQGLSLIIHESDSSDVTQTKLGVSQGKGNLTNILLLELIGCWCCYLYWHFKQGHHSITNLKDDHLWNKFLTCWMTHGFTGKPPNWQKISARSFQYILISSSKQMQPTKRS